MKKNVILAAALLVAATFASAQELPPGKWWQRSEVIEELSLTRDQRERLDEIFRGAADGLIDAKGNVEKLQVALRGELDRSQVRRAEVVRIAQQLNDARGRLFEREIAMLLDMRSVLTEEQWERIRDFLDRRARPRDFVNPGQPRHPQRRPPMQMPGGGRRP